MTHTLRHLSSLTWLVKNSCRSSGCLAWRRGCSGRDGGARAHLNAVLKRDGESRPRGPSSTPEPEFLKGRVACRNWKGRPLQQGGAAHHAQEIFGKWWAPCSESAKTEQGTRLMRQPFGAFYSILWFYAPEGKKDQLYKHFIKHSLGSNPMPTARRAQTHRFK